MTAPSAALVFIVDDDASIRRSLVRLVTGTGYEVEPFGSAHEFLARPQPDGPSCLVLDVRMPGLAGLELQEALATAGRQLSIVFITGYGNVPAAVKAMQGGAVDVLTKPVDGRELLDAIERAVTRAIISPKEKEIIAHHEAGHALVAESRDHVDKVSKISIIPRGVAALGYTQQQPTEDRYLMTRAELLDRLDVLLGGRVAEEIILEDVSTGAHDDLQRASDLAQRGSHFTLGRAGIGSSIAVPSSGRRQMSLV